MGRFAQVGAIAVVFAVAGIGVAQRPTLSFEAVDSKFVEVDACPASTCGRSWIQADYLLWSVRQTPLPPLVTSGSVLDPVPGALGQPNTRLLYGSDRDFDLFSGLRVSAGVWLTPASGIEIGGFGLERRSVGFDTNSDAGGNPLLGRPFFNPLEGAENTLIDSIPGAAVGAISVSSSLRLWGWDANLATRTGAGGVLILGYRTLDLRESLRIADVVSPLADDVLSFNGVLVETGSLISDFDQFSTHNRFHGIQIGGRRSLGFGPIEFGFIGKLALGVTRQTTAIDGASMLQTPSGISAIAPGGLLAQTTNIGRYADDKFTVVPEMGISASMQVMPRVRLRIGYNFLYWSSVVRPGDQIDRTVNPNLVPTAQDFKLPPGPPARPQFSAHQSDFWAHGVDLGLEWRY